MFENLPLLAMARKRMDWVAQRQEVLAKNVANANTPGYRAQDVAPLSFKDEMSRVTPVAQTVTHTSHMNAAPPPPKYDPVVEKRPFETSPDGNAIVLEEQMEKIGEAKGAYELAANLFQKHVRMIRTAIGRSGS